MSLLSSLFSSAKKTNLTPNITPKMPEQINPQAYGDLSKLSHNYINGTGTGFGDDFVNKASNPIAQGWQNQYNQETAPRINSNFSSRGLGNSTLAANAQNQAFSNTQNQINQLMGSFYQLNEAQKKSDTQFGANLGQNLLAGDVGQQNQQAAASERLANATAAQNNYAQGVDQQRAGGLVQAGAQLVAPMMGPLGGGVSGLLNMIPGGSSLNSALSPMGSAFSSGVNNSVKVNTGANSDLMNKLQALFG